MNATEKRARNAARMRAYRAEHPERTRAAQRKYSAQRRALGMSAHYRNDGSHRRTGIIPPRPKPDICDICCLPPNKKGMCLDHCHLTGKFRGWLCDICNRALGLFGDDMWTLQFAIDYLRRAYE